MSEEQQKEGTTCPLCGKGILRLKQGAYVYCEHYKPTKEGKEWVNGGDCDFHVNFKQKAFGRDLTMADMKKLIAGETLKASNGNTMILNVDNQFFTEITFAEKKQDKAF